MEQIRKITPDPDDYQAIHEDEPDLKKVTPRRKAVEPLKLDRRSPTPPMPFSGRHGLPRPITGHSSPTGEDQ